MQHLVAKKGEIYPSWSRDGRALFYRVAEVSGRPATITRVEVRTEPSFAVTDEQAIQVGSHLTFRRTQSYDVTPDGQRVLVLVPPDRDSGESSSPRINVVLNWFTELERRAPTD